MFSAVVRLILPYFSGSLAKDTEHLLGSERTVLMVFSSSQTGIAMSRVHCLSGSGWTPVWAGWDQSSRTCSDTADQPTTPRFDDQMNWRNSPGELTLWGKDTSIPPSIFSLSLLKKRGFELKTGRCVLRLRDKRNLLFCPRLLSGTLSRDGFPCCHAGDPRRLPPLWAHWATMTSTLEVVWRQCCWSWQMLFEDDGKYWENVSYKGCSESNMYFIY